MRAPRNTFNRQAAKTQAFERLLAIFLRQLLAVPSADQVSFRTLRASRLVLDKRYVLLCVVGWTSVFVRAR
jgi:hypothetical protein